MRAKECGLALTDFEILTPGMIIDLIINFYEKQKRQMGGASGDGNQGIRQATQADFDRF